MQLGLSIIVVVMLKCCLDSAGSYGRRFGCGAAILGLYFASFESIVFNAADGRIPDTACEMTAGKQHCAESYHHLIAVNGCLTAGSVPNDN